MRSAGARLVRCNGRFGGTTLARDAVRALEGAPLDALRRARAGNALASLLTYTAPQEGPAGSQTGWCE